MKLKKLVTLATFTAAVIPGLASCSLFGKKQEVGGANVVQIRCYEGGYGYTWLTSLISKFNEMYADQKISATLVEHSTGVTDKSKNEVLDIEGNQIDLYFTNGSSMTNLLQQNIKGYKNKVVFEQLDDVLESKAIGLDGKEEEKTIGERLFNGYKEACQYNGYISRIKGNTYKLPWAAGFTGLFANTKVLSKYGVEVPLTSDELTSAVQSISTHTAADNIYPYSFGGKNTPGYWSYLFETWFGQYSGADQFIKWMKCEPENGDIKNEGYKVYQDIGIKKSLEGMFNILDLNYAPSGSASMNHIDAQTKFVNGESAFFVCGDWIMNEMKTNYGSKQNDVIMLKTPILSSIGKDNGLTTDAELHTVVADIDAGKTDAEIKVDVPAATDALITKVRDARKVVNSIGPTHDAFIPSYSDAKDAAKLFLRFMYSNDGCNIFRKNALSSLPLEYTVDEENKAASSEYMKSLDAVFGQKPNMISGSADYNQVRTQANILFFTNPSWIHVTTYITIMQDKLSATPVLSPQVIYDGEASFVESKWSEWMGHVTF